MSINAQNRCAIHFAMLGKHEMVVNDMIDQEASLDILQFVCTRSNLNVVEILVAAGMSINSIDTFDWSSPMHNRKLTEGFCLNLLSGANVLQEFPITVNLLETAFLNAFLSVSKE